MPYRKSDSSGTRVEFTGRLTRQEIDTLAQITQLDVLQFSKPVDQSNWPALESGLFARRPDVALRAYGHYQDTCDLSFVEVLRSLRRFRADCLVSASNIEAVCTLPELRELSIGILDLTSFDFLNGVSDKLEVLILGETRSRRPSLEPITRFVHLQDLLVSGHGKCLDSIGSLSHLQKLKLHRLKSPDLSFLSLMPNLWWLEFVLGGSEDLSAIAAARGLKHLELSWVRRLGDLSFVSRCISLQRLMIDRLKQVTRLPELDQLCSLRGLRLFTMKGLHSVDPIGDAPTLEWFVYGDATSFQPEDFRVALQAPSLQRVAVGFGSEKKNRRFEEIAAEHGVSIEAMPKDFEFR